MTRSLTKKHATVPLVLSLAAFVCLATPARVDAIGVAFCFLVHGKAGDDIEYSTTVKYALMQRATRTEASEAARAEVERTLQAKYAHLIGQSVYEHGEEINGPYCDTWAFASGYWILIQTKFANSSYSFHTVAAGVGTTEDAASANAIKNLGLHNWSWSRKRHGFEGLGTGDSGKGTGDLAIGELAPP